VFYPVVSLCVIEGQLNFPRIHEKTRSARIKTADEKYIIIGLTNIRQQKIIEVSACVLDSDAGELDLGIFQRPYTYID